MRVDNINAVEVDEIISYRDVVTAEILGAHAAGLLV